MRPLIYSIQMMIVVVTVVVIVVMMALTVMKNTAMRMEARVPNLTVLIKELSKNQTVVNRHLSKDQL
jgi:hypothetical protein